MNPGKLIQKITSTDGTRTPDSSGSMQTDQSDDDFFENDGPYGDGEINILLDSLENADSAPLTEQLERALEKSLAQIVDGVDGVVEYARGESETDSGIASNKSTDNQYSERTRKALSLESAYGHPLSAKEAERLMPQGERGLIWHSLLINGDPFDGGHLKKGLSERDFNLEKKTIKPRRASLPILAKNFYSSLTRIEGPDGPRFIFHGILNGWPSLQTFEVISIQRRRRQNEFVGPAALISGERLWAPMWSRDKQGVKGVDPIIKEKGLMFRIKFRGPPWSVEGWSKENPGFAFWYEPQKSSQVKLTYGLDMISTVDPTPKCTRVHMVAHRYARAKENPKDLLTYHSLVLLEWDNGKYCSVIEAAYLNGLAGWRGKSNFYDDSDAEVPEMYKHFPPEMVCPWLTNAAEIRAVDVAAKNLDEFKKFVSKYEGHDKRFIDPQYCFSHSCRLTYCSKKDIAHYLVNYIRRDVTYSELKRNCQTLAADLCAFLAGKREVLPYHPVNRIEYKNRSHLFLYEPEMYDQNKKKSSIQANEVRI